MNEEGRLIELSGTVQGVGLRPWIYRLAHDAGVSGTVRNEPGGVTIRAYGSRVELETFLERLRGDVPPAAKIARLSWHNIAPAAGREFRIDASTAAGVRAATIAADLPTCAACLHEIFDPGDRRFGYAFTTCTDCGPRFSIARSVPYDRVNTSMAAFTMCDACRAEYDSPASRRFHAEANACPDCGPELRLHDARNRSVTAADAIAAAAAALARGRIVAVKGLGGFHLACDATDENAVRALRTRKRREAKPFAVMVADSDAAARLVELSPLAVRMLEGRERPVVLLPRRAGAGVVRSVAPGGETRLGILLPYAPVHHLLLAAYRRPLVMTSANRAEEPTVHRDADAIARLAGIADLFLGHEREIVNRTDDSVAAVAAGETLVVRRSRGYVPRPFSIEAARLPGADPGPPIAAYGAHLKNACCIAVGDQAYLGPHVGDLETIESYDGMLESVRAMERLLDVRPEIAAHDLHPDYLSTRLARERRARRTIAVQHHHAHLASAMVENGQAGPVLGLAWDGGGLGDDGTVWGSELLLADFAGFRRLATFRPVRLAGGDLAAREIWRSAVAVLEDAFDGNAPISTLELFDAVPAARVATVRRMLAARVNAPASHGLGRWIDAIAAIVLALPTAEYEAQAPMRFEQAATGLAGAPYPWRLDGRADPWQVDLRPTVRAVVADLAAGGETATISARFHRTLVAAGAELLRRAAARFGPLPFAISGGCFQNARIVEGLQRELGGGVALIRNREVPAGDGGIALGQAAIARARESARPPHGQGG